jgi:hypothetical protein
MASDFSVTWQLSQRDLLWIKLHALFQEPSTIKNSTLYFLFLPSNQKVVRDGLVQFSNFNSSEITLHRHGCYIDSFRYMFNVCSN